MSPKNEEILFVNYEYIQETYFRFKKNMFPKKLVLRYSFKYMEFKAILLDKLSITHKRTMKRVKTTLILENSNVVELFQGKRFDLELS